MRKDGGASHEGRVVDAGLEEQHRLPGPLTKHRGSIAATWAGGVRAEEGGPHNAAAAARDDDDG